MSNCPFHTSTATTMPGGFAVGGIQPPKDKHFDCTFPLLREGFLFLPHRHLANRSDIFQSRLMLQKAIFITGPEAVALFYDNTRFTREGALPWRIQKTLMGSKGVQMLDGEMHTKRKAMFLSLLDESSRHLFTSVFSHYWKKAVPGWQQQVQVNLFDEVQQMLFQAACDWAAVPYTEAQAVTHARDMGLMVDAFGAVGPRHWRGRFARRRMEKWALELIHKLRSGRIWASHGTVFHTLAMHRDVTGKQMPAKVAAVELLNIIRPTVAIATFVSFIAHAFAREPEWKTRLMAHPAQAHAFVQEVRRLYPFTPFVGARVRESFEWKGYRFPKGRMVILDIYGIDHDERLWERPNEFCPERFMHGKDHSAEFIPQGGGDAAMGHRCPGEALVVEVMETAALLLAQLSYALPEQDLSIDMSRMPTLPKSRVLLSRVHLPVNGRM